MVYATIAEAVFATIAEAVPGESFDLSIHAAGCHAADGKCPDGDAHCTCDRRVLHHGHELSECEALG